METVSDSANVLLQLHLAHARSLRAALGAYQSLPHKRLSGAELESSLQAHIELTEELGRLYAAEYERAVKDSSRDATDLRQSRESWENLIASCMDALRLLGELVERMIPDAGPSSEGRQRLAEAAADLRRLQARLAEEWPVCNSEELNAARAQIERGETLDLEETFARIAGVDRAAWLERVTAQQRKFRSSEPVA